MALRKRRPLGSRLGLLTPLAYLCPMPLAGSCVSGEAVGLRGHLATKKHSCLPLISFQTWQVHEILSGPCALTVGWAVQSPYLQPPRDPDVLRLTWVQARAKTPGRACMLLLNTNDQSDPGGCHVTALPQSIFCPLECAFPCAFWGRSGLVPGNPL